MPLSRQEIFNEVKKHLLTQMQQSKDGNMCMYRSPEGLKCAVGIFIPDDLYSPNLEGSAVPELLQALPTIAEEDVPFLRSLQLIHDDYPPESWERELENCRKRHDLN